MRGIPYDTYDIGCANDQFGFDKFILQELGLLFLPKFFLPFWGNFFFYLIEETFFFTFLPKLFFFFLPKIHLANFIWRNFIWRVHLTKLHLAKPGSPGSTPATPVTLIFSNGWTDRQTNKHTHAQLYYRYIVMVKHISYT